MQVPLVPSCSSKLAVQRYCLTGDYLQVVVVVNNAAALFVCNLPLLIHRNMSSQKALVMGDDRLGYSDQKADVWVVALNGSNPTVQLLCTCAA